MKIVHVSAECYPAAKVGGLADVVGALPKYQNALGHTAQVVMPYYKTKYFLERPYRVVQEATLPLGHQFYPYKILQIEDSSLGYELYTVVVHDLLERENVYSYGDDTARFMAFQKGVMEWLLRQQVPPDIVHCHDHHSGLIPFMVSKGVHYTSLRQTPTVLTIHNGQYQGQFGFDLIHFMPEFYRHDIGLLEWGGMINPLASAIKCAWRITTVSPSYLEEIQHTANGLEALLSHERGKSVGILNGIDTQVWNPVTDPMLHVNYSIEDLEEGKGGNKAWLCEIFQLDPNKPLFAFIGRLVYEKGADLLPEAFYQALNDHRGRLNILLLGSGDINVENQLNNIKNSFAGNYNTYIGYNEELAHRVYGGADFLLMPSRVEPCGLNQMYAMRYGTIPIVRRTGGLRDTVLDMGDPGGFGICHDQSSVWDVTYSMSRALGL